MSHRKEIKDFIMEVTSMGFTRVPSGKHIKMHNAEHNVTLMIPKTPSDWRAMRNARAMFRRLLRDMDSTKQWNHP